MAQRGVHIEKISCSICLDLLKDPVTIPCGHSYCRNCINTHWDGEEHKRLYSCPQCRKTFKSRPILEKNIMLAELVDEKKETGFQAALADHYYAGPEDVSCDVCTGRKMKAFMFCLTCDASYCRNHLQGHYDAPPLKKHKLVDPSRTEKQKELQVSRQKIQRRIQDQKKDVKLLPEEVDAINVSADKTVEDSEKIFTELICLIQKRSSDVKQQIRSQQETEVSPVKELQEELLLNIFLL